MPTCTSRSGRTGSPGPVMSGISAVSAPRVRTRCSPAPWLWAPTESRLWFWTSALRCSARWRLPAPAGPAQLGSRPGTADGGDSGPDLGNRSAGAAADLGSRSEDGPGKLGSRPDGGAEDLGSRPDVSAQVSARPHRLPDGSWGVFSREKVAPGDQVQVQVRTAGGQSWVATVVEVVEQGPRGTVARARSGPRPERR